MKKFTKAIAATLAGLTMFSAGALLPAQYNPFQIQEVSAAVQYCRDTTVEILINGGTTIGYRLWDNYTGNSYALYGNVSLVESNGLGKIYNSKNELIAYVWKITGWKIAFC